MKKLLLLFFIVILATNCVLGTNSDRSKKINFKELPQVSQEFLKKHFGDLSSAVSVYLWPRDYSVSLKSGQKINFYLDGSLKEADAERGTLPKSILRELPSNISIYVDQKYKEWTLVVVEIKRSKIEIELEHGKQTVNMEFNKSGELIDEDLDD